MDYKLPPDVNLIFTSEQIKTLTSALEITKIAVSREQQNKNENGYDTAEYSKFTGRLKSLDKHVSYQIWEAKDIHKKGFFTPVRPWFTWNSIRLKNRNCLPESPGIYVVASLWNVLYVGKAQDLRARWRGSGHHRYDQATKIFMPRIYYIELPLVTITRTEEYTIEKLSPLWNWTPALHKKYAESSRNLRQKLNFLEFGLIGVLLTVLIENRDVLLSVVR